MICGVNGSWIEKTTFTKCENIRATPLVLLCEWVVQAWDAIDPVIVKKSFLNCGISNSPDGEEDDWLWKGCDDVPSETVDNELIHTTTLSLTLICWSFSTPIVKMKKNYHEAILAVQVDPNFLVVFFFY